LRLFTDVLRDFRKGAVVAKASEDLQAVTQAVMETGKPGQLTVTITIKPPKSRGDNVLEVSAQVTPKAPQHDLPTAMFFADVSGDLLRDDPTQQRLFAGVDHDPATGEVREA
jgi:hypothetical protein